MKAINLRGSMARHVCMYVWKTTLDKCRYTNDLIFETGIYCNILFVFYDIGYEFMIGQK